MRAFLALACAMAIGLSAAGGSTRTPLGVATCDVAVLDQNDQPIQGLTANDFTVLTDGAPAAVARVTSAPAEMTMLLLADATTSQPLRRYEIVKALATHWIPGLHPTDRFRIGVLATPLTLSPWLTPDPRTTMASVRPVIDRAAAEPSPLWDAADAAIEALAEVSGPRMLLILSDGRANANRLGLDDVASRAIAADVAVSSVSEGGERELPQAGDAAVRVRPDASLQWLADHTGGVFVPDGVARRRIRPQMDPFAYVKELVQTPSAPGPLLVRVTTALRARYRLTFAAPSDGRQHTLEVGVSRAGASVRVKKRFVAAASISDPLVRRVNRGRQ